MATRTENLAIRITVDGEGNVKASLAGVEKSLDKIKPKAEEGGIAIGKVTEAVGELVRGFTLMEGAKFLIESIVNAQMLETRLRAVTDSQEEFNGALATSKTIAKETANSADQATQAYINLRSRGLAPSLETMRSLANIGAATGKSIDEVASAVSSALTGQVRGLQDLGIHVENENGRLVSTFNGTKEDIGRSANDIVSYLVRIGNTRYAGAAAQEASTLAGQWAQLKQAAGDLAESVGGSGLTEELTAFIHRTTEEIHSIEELMERLGAVVDKITDKVSGALNTNLLGRFGINDPYHGTFSNVSAGSVSKNDESGLYAAETAAYNQNTEAASRNRLAKLNLAQADAQVANASQGVIDQMQKQLVSMQQGEAASIRYAAQQAAAKADTKEHADRIRELGEQIAKVVEKRKADADAIKQETALFDAYNEGLQRTNALLADEERRKRELSDAYNAVLDVIEPETREVRSLEDAYRKMSNAMDESRKNGELTTEQVKAQTKALEDLGKRLDDVHAKANLAKMLGAVTGDKSSAVGELDSIMSDVAQAFTEELKNGFKDAGKTFGDVLGKIGDQILNDIIQNKIVKNLANAAGGGSLDVASLAEGGGAAIGTYAGVQIGGGGEHAAQGASAGASAGAAVGTVIFPVIGTIIGAVIGGIIGGLAGGAFDSTTAKVYSGPNSGSSTGGIDAFGRVQAYTHGMGDGAESQLLQALMQLDNSIAAMLSGDEIKAVKAALEGHVSEAATPDEALADRLNVIISAVEPKWVAFLNKFEDVQGKAAAFAALRNIDDQLEHFGRILASVSGDSVEQLNSQLEAMDSKVTDTAKALADAIEAQDPVKIEAAASASIQAVVDRYNAEIQLAQNLEQAIHAAQQAAYQLNLTIAQRLASLSGNNAGVISLSQGRIDELQGSIPGENPAQGLGDLNDYIGAVDTWFQAGSQDIQNWLNNALGALQAQAQAQQAAAQRAAQAAQEARQRELNALQQQLQLAQQWVQVLEHAKAMQEQLQFGQSNPLGGFGQLAAINQAIAQYTQPTAGADALSLNSTDANHLLDLLQQRLELIQSQGLFQRSSNDYLDQYNSTLAMIQQVQALAQPGVDEATELQRQIVDLQAQTVSAVSSGTGNIAAQEAALRAEAQARLDGLKDQARTYYEWAQGQAQTLEDARAQDLLDQLNALTHGLPVQDFIALKQQEATELLTDIRDDLRTFLDAVEAGGSAANNGAGNGNSGSTGNGNTDPGAGTGGGGGDGVGANALGGSGNVYMQVTVNANGLDQDAASRLVRRELLASAPEIKRALKVA